MTHIYTRWLHAPENEIQCLSEYLPLLATKKVNDTCTQPLAVKKKYKMQNFSIVEKFTRQLFAVMGRDHRCGRQAAALCVALISTIANQQRIALRKWNV